MKQLLFTALFVVCGLTAPCQTSIYVCDKTGASGIGYSRDGKLITIEQCRDTALRKCKEAGGSECYELFTTDKPGWGVLVYGRTKDGQIFWQKIVGGPSEHAAVDQARFEYEGTGGIDFDKMPRITWRAY